MTPKTDFPTHPCPFEYSKISSSLHSLFEISSLQPCSSSAVKLVSWKEPNRQFHISGPDQFRPFAFYSSPRKPEFSFSSAFCDISSNRLGFPSSSLHRFRRFRIFAPDQFRPFAFCSAPRKPEFSFSSAFCDISSNRLESPFSSV